jgi:sec-independent protein translocase protein TatA
MFGLGTTELLLILIIVVVLFGARKLPELGAGVAKGIRSFRKNMAEDEGDKSASDKADSDKKA